MSDSASNSQNTRRQSTDWLLLLIGLVLGLLFCFLEASLHVLFFDDTDLVTEIIHPSAHEVWMRLSVLGMFIAFAFYASQLISAWKSAEHKANSAKTELSQIFETSADGMRIVDRKFRTDDSRVPCTVTATPFRSPEGEILGIVEDFKDISDRRESESALKASRERLRKLASHIQTIHEEERHRVAREIHDELGQALTALNMDIHWLKRHLSSFDEGID